MRPLLLNLAVTLDGFIEGPHGEIDWCLTDQDYGMTAFLERCDALLMGRKSYDSLLTYDANAWPDKQRYVFSRSLGSVPNGTERFQGDVATEVRRLQELPGRGIWLFGGADLIAQCLQAGLVDELCLAIHPVLLGGGRPLFHALARTPLRLLDTVTYSSGLVQVTYGVVR